jgi:hypothetical protein
MASALRDSFNTEVHPTLRRVRLLRRCFGSIHIEGPVQPVPGNILHVRDKPPLHLLRANGNRPLDALNHDQPLQQRGAVIRRRAGTGGFRSTGPPRSDLESTTRRLTLIRTLD